MEAQSSQKVTPVKLFHTVFCPLDVDDSKTPIILVHGVGATNGTWNGVKMEIGALTKRKIISVDLRGHGKSEWPEMTSMEHVVLDLENFMAEQNISRAIFLGHSYGGRAALGLAFKRPDLVERLLLEDVFLHFKGTWESVLRKMYGVSDVIKRLPTSLSEEEANKLIWKQCETLFPDEAKNFQMKQTKIVPFYKDPKTGKFKTYFDMDTKLGNFEFDLSNFPTYDGKSLVMTAEKSNYNQEGDIRELRSHLPNSREVCIIGGTHALHIENPEQFVKEATRFINED